jgi:hypothetical protein
MITPPRIAEGAERELLDAAAQVQEADQARTRALARYDQATARVAAQDNQRG